MNSSVYLFGKENNGNDFRYSQYPNDYTVNMFRQFEVQLQTDTLLALNREGDLVYHVYLKRIDNGYFGICISLNGVWIHNTNALLKIFENAFVNVVSQGLFVNVSDQGKTMFRASQMSTHTDEAKEICSQLGYRLTELEHFCKHLPPINVAVNANVALQLPNSASDKEWEHALNSYRSMYANYSKSEAEGQFYKLLDKIKSLSSECNSLKNKNTELEEKCNQIEKQKKQYKKVIILVFLLLIGSIITALLISQKNDDISNLQENVVALNLEVDQLSVEVREKTKSLAVMTENKNSLEDTVRQKEGKIDQLESRIRTIGNHYPIMIEKIEIGNTDYNGNIETDYGNAIYSSQTLYLSPKIYYTGLISGSVNLKVKWFKPDGTLSTGISSPTGFSQSNDYYFYSGSGNDKVLKGWGGTIKGHWQAGTYRIEIWYEDVCLKVKTFTIY